MINLGDSYSQKFIASDEVVRDIAKVSGDINPVHLDEEYAKETIFGKRIAHGLFCLNAISMILGNYFPGNGTILLSQSFKYINPVYINDEIEVVLTVQEINHEKNIYVLSTVCKNQNSKIVLEGASTVKWMI